MENLLPKTIDEFINTAPKESQEIMLQLKALIENTVPNAVGKLNWNMPVYEYKGILTGFSLATTHVTFGIDSLNDDYRKILEDKGYKTGIFSIEISFEQNVPTEEIIHLIKEQVKFNEM